jgi:hypothetical protein
VLAGWLGWRRVPAQTADPEAIAWVEPVQPGSTASTAVLQSQTAEPDREAVSVRTPVLDAPELATPLRTRLQVRGTVRDEEHRPVSEAEVRWIDDLGRATRSSLYEGAYLVPDLQLGHYLVQVSGVRWRLQEFDVELPSAPAFQERELRVQANPELLVRVRERDGRAWPHCDGERRTLLQCLQVHLSRTAPAEELQSAASLDESNAGLGTFLGRRPSAPSSSDAPVDSIGTLELAQDPPAFVSLALGTAVVASARVERVSPEIAFTLALEDLRANFAGLRLRIVRADDRTPVANASAWLDANGHTSFHASRTDAQGRLEIADIPPGLGELSLQGPNRVRRDLVVRFQRGRVLDLGDVVLASQPRQPVRLEFPGDPQPVRFALESEVPGSVPARFDTGDAFQFELEPRRAQEIPFPGRGAYVLRVLSVGGPKSDGAGSLGGLPQRIVFGDRPESEIAVKIEPTTEICLRPARDALGNSRWLVSTADGLPCQCVQVEGRAPTRIALPQGAYTIGRIDPDSARPGTLQPFTVDAEFRVLDLFP